MQNPLEEKIRKVLAKLDATNDSHWTGDGAPLLDHVSKKVGAPLTREDLVRVAPKFTRQNPDLSMPEEKPASEAQGAPTIPPPAPVENTLNRLCVCGHVEGVHSVVGGRCTQSDSGCDCPGWTLAPNQEHPQAEPPREASPFECLKKEHAAAAEDLARAQRRFDQLTRELDAAIERGEGSSRSIPFTEAHQRYKATVEKERAARAERIAGRPQAVDERAPIDRVMARPQGYGHRRPAVRPPG